MSTAGSTVRARRRLDPGVRRGELLDAAARAFAADGYEAVRMDRVARDAGSSRALLYRYFPTKADLFADVYRRAAEDLLAETELDPDLRLLEQIRAGLDVHLDYFVANERTVLAANRTLAGDPVVAAIIGDELDELRRRLLDAARLEGVLREAVSGVVLAWLVQVRVLTVEWLAMPASARPYDRDVLREICTGALLGGLAALPGVDRLLS